MLTTAMFIILIIILDLPMWAIVTLSILAIVKFFSSLLFLCLIFVLFTDSGRGYLLWRILKKLKILSIGLYKS